MLKETRKRITKAQNEQNKGHNTDQTRNKQDRV